MMMRKIPFLRSLYRFFIGPMPLRMRPVHG
jgi:hypothetical protein